MHKLVRYYSINVLGWKTGKVVHQQTNTEISLVKERIINVTQSKKSHVGKRKSSELGPDNEIIPNPPTVKMQKQKRCQPSAIVLGFYGRLRDAISAFFHQL
jgi:hypothetical protein